MFFELRVMLIDAMLKRGHYFSAESELKIIIDNIHRLPYKEALYYILQLEGLTNEV